MRKRRFADGGNTAGNTASGSPAAAFMQQQYPTPPATFSTPSPGSGSGSDDSSKGAGITINVDGKQSGFRKGGAVKKSSSVKKRTTSSASKRADGAAQRGKTRGRYI
jgi:hypothetical protein